MNAYLQPLAAEVVLAAAACVLFLLGVVNRAGVRRFCALLALLSLGGVFIWQALAVVSPNQTLSDPTNTVRVYELAQYFKMLAAAMGAIFVLMNWPENADATGNAALDFGEDAGEFFGLLLLSICGIGLVASANDLILLFLGIELASIPTYIMVSISRPLASAKEAGLKYFFLGAMSAALILFGFSYLFGMSGQLKLDAIARQIGQGGAMSPMLWTGVLFALAGFSFKLAAAPMHFYAPDVYQGAATPVTALLSFVPKAAGMAALLKLLWVVGGGTWNAPPMMVKLLWVVAVLTMSIGNLLGLMQYNVKRTLACSSIAHSGYMLTAVTALIGAGAGQILIQQDALSGILFYLTAYGIMNAGAFGVLMMLPARNGKGTAETFEDLAGQGRRHPVLGLVMAICCFSLIGIPLTVGFLGKIYLIRPALDAGMIGLVVITVINAAVSAGYYLRIIGAMYLRPLPEPMGDGVITDPPQPLTLTAAVIVSVAGTLALGMLPPATNLLTDRTTQAAQLEPAGNK